MSDQTEGTNASAETESQEAQTIPDAAHAGGAPGGEAAEDELEPGLTDRQARRDERWRDRARAAEERADRLTTREVLRVLGRQVNDAKVALAMAGEPVGNLLDDDGDVDEDAVAALAKRVLAQHPTLHRTGHHMDLGPKASLPQGRRATWGGLVSGR